MLRVKKMFNFCVSNNLLCGLTNALVSSETFMWKNIHILFQIQISLTNFNKQLFAYSTIDVVLVVLHQFCRLLEKIKDFDIKHSGFPEIIYILLYSLLVSII